MKKIRGSIFLFAFSAAVLIVGILVFTLTYSSVPEITDTKLHVFTFQRLEDNVLYCADGKEVHIMPKVMAEFDTQRFNKHVRSGDKIFVRVENEMLEDDLSSYMALAIICSEGECLSMENVSASLIKYNNYALCTLLITFVLVAFLSTVGIILLKRNK